jgi:hypothetical protein
METTIMTESRIRYLRLISTATALALSACGGGGDDNSSGTPAVTQGTIAVSLQNDAPSCGFSEVNVTVTKLRFHENYNASADASGWAELNFSPAKKINLLTLSSVLGGATTALGDVTLPVGIYTQMVVVFDANTSGSAHTVKLGGASTEVPLETATTLANGVRVPIDLKVVAGQNPNLMLDFDACASIQRRGTAYVLKPRPRNIPEALNGIQGFVDKSALTSNVVLTAQQNGGIYATTVPNPNTGEFVLPRLPAGNYDLVVQGNGRATDVIGAVPVAPSGFTSVATAAAPIPLATSAVSSISGKVTYTAPATAPADGTWIMASQSITANTTIGNAATTITYRLQPVDLNTGAYTLTNLPRSSVQYALYKPTLPLTLVAAATSAGNGRYRIESAATGYSNKTNASANINVSTADATAIDIVLP